MSNVREVYVVKTKHGYLSTVRFNHVDGSHRLEDAAFDKARIFTRESDADNACTKRSDRVVVCNMVEV